MIHQRLTYVEQMLLNIQNERNCNRIESVLIVAKNLYGELWEICCKINKIFGCSLAMINVEFMFDIINDAYWFYQGINQSTVKFTNS